MNKREIIASVAEKKGVSRKEVEVVLEGLLETIIEVLHREETVLLVGFGSFSVKERAERIGYNPSTKGKLVIPARRVVRFKPGMNLELDKV